METVSGYRDIIYLCNAYEDSQNKQRVKEVLDQRRHVRDEFRTENGYSWDFCMVFKVYNNRDNATELQNKWNLKYILRELTRGGFQTKSFYSAQVGTDLLI